VQKTLITEREKYERSPQEERREVLTRRGAKKHRHESGVEANTQTSPIGKGSNQLSALIAKSERVKKQALLEVNIGGGDLDQVELLSTKLIFETILGLDFPIN
jgi:hypothetical protein